MRPLAVVMVADPTPLTLENLRQLAAWCDLLLTEGTATMTGARREPLRSGWRELLELEPPRIRVLTTDVGGHSRTRREAMQRNSAMAVIGQEPDERVVLLLDADEFLDVALVRAVLDDPPDEPVRLGLVPLYGAIDRVARSIHCCWKPDWPDLRAEESEPRYVVPCPALATAAMMRGQLPARVRFASRLLRTDTALGIHVTMCDTTERVAWKLANTRHVWDPRALEPRHLDTMLGAGVHHAGWWVAAHREPEPWLRDLAEPAGLRLAGPPAPPEHLRALRAWAEARLDPRVPDELVRAGDDYVAWRPHEADDFLTGLDAWLLDRPVGYCGHVGDPDIAVVTDAHDLADDDHL